MQYLSGVMRMFDILEQNITKVENIEKMRDPQPTMETIYLLCSTSQNVDRIINDLAPSHDSPPQYEAAHIFFVDACGPMNTKFAPTMDESLALLQDELDMATQTLVNVCITLNENPLIRYLNVPGKVLGPLSVEAQADTVEGTFAADDARKNQGLGRVQIGMPFTQQLALRVQAALDEYTSHGQMLGDPGRPRGVLFITDRSMDLWSPFLHEFTYQAMVYDLIDIQDGKYKHSFQNAEGEKEEIDVELNDEDDVWTRIRHLHIAEAIEYLTREFKSHMGEASQFNDHLSIDGMRDMLASLPHMQQTKQRLSVHLTLAQLCMDKFEKSMLAAQAMVEQNSATGQTPEGSRPKTLIEEMVPLLDNPTISGSDKVRIIALYILFCDGVQDEDRRRLFQHARLTGGEMAAVNNLVHLSARVVRETSASSLDAIFRKRRKTLAPRLPAAGQAEYELSRFQPLIRTMMEDHLLSRLDQSMFPYVRDAPQESRSTNLMHQSASFSASAQDYATGLLHSAISATGGKDSPLARVGFGFDGSSASRSQVMRAGTTSLRSAKPTWHQKGRSQSVTSLGGATVGAGGTSATARTASSVLTEMSNPTAQRMIVFMSGGMTYSEIRTAYQVGKRNNTEVYLGSSHVFTPSSFIESLRLMGTPRQPPPPDLHVEQRRQAEEQQAIYEEEVKKGHKKPKLPLLKKPKYPQELPPQERYDLRFSTPEVPEAVPEVSEKSGSRRISEQIKSKVSDVAHGHKSTEIAPPASSTTTTSSPEVSDAKQATAPSTKPKWTRDMSRFKNAFSIKK
ncbi:syntaxin binding protein 1 [Malassezia equina]|uniref:Syntaxin binding protein 1 n=1 Tax=Malassezia equina TaxID=1381935 RepID=A0AAF0EDE3_9BASI|nr:syntaxin binding protein 1 [Malassezia equina]